MRFDSRIWKRVTRGLKKNGRCVISEIQNDFLFSSPENTAHIIPSHHFLTRLPRTWFAFTKVQMRHTAIFLLHTSLEEKKLLFTPTRSP